MSISGWLTTPVAAEKAADETPREVQGTAALTELFEALKGDETPTIVCIGTFTGSLPVDNSDPPFAGATIGGIRMSVALGGSVERVEV